MNLEDIQTTARTLILAVTEIADAEVPVLIDDGSYPKVEGREEALRGGGLSIIVTPVHAHGIVDAGRGGLTSMDVGFHVVIAENAKVNRGDAGTGVVCEKAVRLVMAGLVGKPNTSAPGKPIALDDPPFEQFGTTNGVRQMVVNCVVRSFVNPTP